MFNNQATAECNDLLTHDDKFIPRPVIVILTIIWHLSHLAVSTFNRNIHLSIKITVFEFAMVNLEIFIIYGTIYGVRLFEISVFERKGFLNIEI